MPQGDMNVANGSGATVRADFNDQLAALVQLSSGATAPATTFAHMLWADTSPTGYTIIKIRDAADAVWSTLYDDEGRWKGIDGTAAEPSISFGADVDNGWYRIGANSWGASVAGLLALWFDASGNLELTHATLPKFIISEEDQAGDEKKWQISGQNSDLFIGPIPDLGGVGRGGLQIERGAADVVATYFFGVGQVALAAERLVGAPDLIWSPVRPDSGMYEIANDHFGIAVSGVKAWEMDANSDVTQVGAFNRTPVTITTDTTPTAVGRAVIIIGTWAAGNDITDFDNETAGQVLKILGGDGDCNIVDGAPIQLVGGVAWNGAAGATLELWSDGAIWYEHGRSDAS